MGMDLDLDLDLSMGMGVGVGGVSVPGIDVSNMVAGVGINGGSLPSDLPLGLIQNSAPGHHHINNHILTHNHHHSHNHNPNNLTLHHRLPRQ